MSHLEMVGDTKSHGTQSIQVDQDSDATLRFLDIELDWQAHRVRRGKRIIHLSTLDLRLLRFLMLAPTRVFTRNEILKGVWPRGIFVTERTVDVHMAALRKALSDVGAPNPVRTVRGRGYSLDNDGTD
ncbi:MAG: DNA-binding response regulator [Rhodospirillales bacterium]|nr:DNA-binding response regulator [Rhodospirillales bacterium]